MIVSRATMFNELVRQMKEAGIPEMRDISQEEWETFLDAAKRDPDVVRRVFEDLVERYVP